MGLHIDLHLDERHEERVAVTVYVSPTADTSRVEGLIVELRTGDGERLGPKLCLPVAGELTGPLSTHAVVHADRPIPKFSEVVATAWADKELTQLRVPAELSTALEAHVRGQVLSLRGTPQPEALTPLEAARLEEWMPWISEPPRRQQTQLEPLLARAEHADEVDPVDEIAADLGLDEENAEWLKELLRE